MRRNEHRGDTWCATCRLKVGAVLCGSMKVQATNQLASEGLYGSNLDLNTGWLLGNYPGRAGRWLRSFRCPKCIVHIVPRQTASPPGMLDFRTSTGAEEKGMELRHRGDPVSPGK